MIAYCKRTLLLLLLTLLLLAACDASTTQQTSTKKLVATPTLNSGQGQQLLAALAQSIRGAKTLHAVLDVTVTGQAFNGTIDTELWNVPPDKNRTVVLQSSLVQFPVGSLIVSNGKQLWQYDPTKKVVYTGPLPAPGTPTPGSGAGNRQSQFILGLVQSVLTRGKATLVSASQTVDGHSVYDIHVVSPPGQATGSGPNFNYSGEVYIDKVTQQLVRVDLTTQGLGMVTLDVPKLVLNQPIPDSLFTFVPPAGVKVLPLQAANAIPRTGAISFVQAQQQAGYHLLSIPGSDTDYELESVTALGAPGNQIFTLNYTKGNQNFLVAEGKSLAGLPGSTGQQINLRGTIATLSTSNGTTTLAWTEHGVGIRITGSLSGDEAVQIAKLLS